MDSDCTQHNGTPKWVPTADAATAADVYLVPTDGKLITAESNSTNQAPVNRALKTAKDLLLGLREAIIGDIGTTVRSFRKIYADEVGGVPVGMVPDVQDGDIYAKNRIRAIQGNITAQLADIETLVGEIRSRTDLRAVLGDVIAEAGDIVAQAGAFLAEHAAAYIKLGTTKATLMNNAALAFFGTGSGATDSNPPATTPTPNQLRALNTPKAWVTFQSDGTPTGMTVLDAHATTSVISTGLKVTIAFATPFVNAHWAYTWSLTDYKAAEVDVRNKTPNGCDVYLYDNVADKSWTAIAANSSCSMLFFGRQAT